MHYRKHGKWGLKVSEVSLGGWTTIRQQYHRRRLGEEHQSRRHTKAESTSLISLMPTVAASQKR